jgi:hypothetical protein
MAFKKRLTAEQTVRCYSIHDPCWDADKSDFVAYGKTLDDKHLQFAEGAEGCTGFELRPLSVDEHDAMLLEQLDAEEESERKSYAKLALKTAKACATVLDDELELSELPFSTRVELGGYAIRLSLGQLLPDGEEAADDVEK